MQASIFAGFRGKLRKGLIRQATATTSDDLGDATDSAPVDTKIEGFTDSYSETYRAAAGIPSTDLKVLIFGGSAPSITPVVDDKVMLMLPVAGVLSPSWFQLRGPIKTDPAVALWTCQAYPIPVPV